MSTEKKLSLLVLSLLLKKININDRYNLILRRPIPKLLDKHSLVEICHTKEDIWYIYVILCEFLLHLMNLIHVSVIFALKL